MKIPVINKELNIPKFSESTIKRIILITLLVIILIFIIMSIYFVVTTLKSEKVYNGIYLNGIHVGGMDIEEFNEYLDKTYSRDIDTLELSIYHEDYPYKTTFSDLNVKIDLEATYKNVYSVGRTGNIIDRLLDIYDVYKTHRLFTTELSYDEEIIYAVIDKISEKINVSIKNSNLLILQNKVILNSGSYGVTVDKNLLYGRILEQLQMLESGIVIVPTDDVPPSPIDSDKYYNMITLEEEKAFPVVKDNSYIEIVPHIVGRAIDKADLLNIVAEVEYKFHEYKKPVEVELPVDYIIPTETIKYIEELLFVDNISEYSTQFYTATVNDANRGINIRLATKKIDGYILSPGEEFSFNDVVGRRTQEAGYQIAHVYVNGEIIDGIGGGICQVSTTLYNALLEGNFEVTDRVNHMFQVGYVPLGRDAAVSYGEADLKFVNNTEWPIKVISNVSDTNKIYFSMMGTNESKNIQIEIKNIWVGTTPYETLYIDNPELEEGMEVLEHKGINGAIVETYKITKKGRIILSETFLHKSIYKPYAETIKRGIKPIELPIEETEHDSNTIIEDNSSN